MIFIKQYKKYIKLFLLIFIPAIVIFTAAAAAVTLSMVASANRVGTERDTNPSDPLPGYFETAAPEREGSERAEPTAAPLSGDEGESVIKPPLRTNFMLVALDQSGALTDVIIVGCFYRDTGEVKLMSVPRDTYTKISEERLDEMRAEGLHPPDTMKINSLRSWGGKTHGVDFLMDQLGEMLGVHFKYYAEIDIPAFKKIVEVLGGVDMEVPTAMNYEDPVQDLYIHIPAGMQHIDADTAEQLVRFRSYPSGALGRDSVQLEFLKQLLRQALKKETVMRDPLAIADVILNDIRHNIGMDIIKYAPYISSLSGDKITTYTMPGEGTNGSISWFLPDADELPGRVREVFYADGAETEAETVEERLSHGLKINILNGSRVAGLGSSLRDSLVADGYTVENVDAYTGSKQNTTQILTREEGQGEDLIPYFTRASIEKDDSIPEEYDIVIILGQGER